MTNIIATIVVCLITNVIHSDNGTEAYSQIERNGWSISCLVMGCTDDHDLIKAVPVTKRTETTTVTEVKTLTFEWDNIRHTETHKRIISESVRKFSKKEEWKEILE